MKQSFDEFYDDVKKQYGDEIVEESNRVASAKKDIIKGYFKSPAFWIVLCIYIVWFLLGIVVSVLTAVRNPVSSVSITISITTILVSSFSLLVHASIALLITGVIYYVIKSNKIKKELSNKYKYIVYSKMLGNFYEGLGLLDEKERASFAGYNWKSIYDNYFKIEAYNRSYIGDVFVAKKNDKVKLQGSELTLQYHTSDSKGHSHTRLIFKGLLCELFLDKSINGDVQVNRNQIKSASGFLGSKVVKQKYKKKIEMDSRDFEEKFEVFASNGVLAMQILTAEIMQDLIDLYDKTHFDFAVVNDRIYFRINAPELFELNTSIFSNNISNIDNLKGKLKENYEIVNNAFDIINKIEKLVNERF